MIIGYRHICLLMLSVRKLTQVFFSVPLGLKMNFTHRIGVNMKLSLCSDFGAIIDYHRRIFFFFCLTRWFRFYVIFHFGEHKFSDAYFFCCFLLYFTSENLFNVYFVFVLIVLNEIVYTYRRPVTWFTNVHSNFQLSAQFINNDQIWLNIEVKLKGCRFFFVLRFETGMFDVDLYSFLISFFFNSVFIS